MYKLGTLRPQGLNEDDRFYAQNRKTRVGARSSLSSICNPKIEVY